MTMEVKRAGGGGAGSSNSGWTDDGTVVRLTTATDKVGIGNTNPQSALSVGSLATFNSKSIFEIYEQATSTNNLEGVMYGELDYDLQNNNNTSLYGMDFELYPNFAQNNVAMNRIDSIYNLVYVSQDQGLTGNSFSLITGYYAQININNGITVNDAYGLLISAVTGAVNNWGIYVSDASAKNYLAGVLQLDNKITKYNGIATVSNGAPAEYATVDLTGQTAAITATTAYAVPASGAGMYRISWVAKVTTAASVSSVLGGTNGFQIKYTDADDSVVVTTGALANENTLSLSTNTTQTIYVGALVVNAKASTNIQYLMDYTSAGGTAMQYNLHLKVEAL